MATEQEIAKLIVTLEGNVRNLGASFNQARSTTKTFAGELNKSFAGIKRNWLAVTAAIAAGALTMRKTFSTFSEFAQKMREVFTLLDVPIEQFHQLSAAVLELTKTVPQSAKELAAAQYDIVSAGVTDLAESMQSLELSAKAAVAGVTDTKTAANAGISVVNAYGKEISELGNVYDTLFQTVRLGVTTFDQLAQFIGPVLPVARAAGISFEEVSAAIATMTKAGIQTNKAVTFLRGSIVALAAPTEEAKENMAALGITWNGLVPTLEQIAEKGLSIDQLRNLIPDIRAGQAILALSQNMDTFKDILSEIQVSAGAMDAAYEKMADTPENQMKLFTNAIERLVIKMQSFAATAFLPQLKEISAEFDKMIASGAAEQIGEAIGNLVKLLADLFVSVIKNWKIIVGFGIATVLFKFVTLIKSLYSAILLLNAAMLANPLIAGVAGGILALGAFAVAIKSAADNMRELNEEYETWGHNTVTITNAVKAEEEARVKQAQQIDNLYTKLVRMNKAVAETVQGGGYIPAAVARQIEPLEDELEAMGVVLEKDLLKRMEQIHELALSTAVKIPGISDALDKATKEDDKKKKTKAPGVPSEQILAQAEANVAEYVAAISLSLDQLENAYGDQQIAIDEYFTRRLELANSVAQQEIALLQKKLDYETDETKRIALRSAIELREIMLGKEVIRIEKEKAAAIKKSGEDQKAAAQMIEQARARVHALTATPGGLAEEFAQRLRELDAQQTRELEAFKKLEKDKTRILELEHAHRLEREAEYERQRQELRDWNLAQLSDIANRSYNINNTLYQDLLNLERRKAEASNKIAEAEGKAKKEITEKTLLEGNKSLRAAFVFNQSLAAANVTISTLAGAIKAYEQLGVYGSAVAALITAEGALAVGKIIGTTIAQFAEGGPIKQGSGPKSDDVLIRASRGEFMQPASAVSYYGEEAMEAIRRRKVPRGAFAGFSGLGVRQPFGRFAEGGLVGPGPISGAFARTGEQLQIVNVVDTRLVDRHLSSAAGKRTVLNILADQAYEVKRILR